MATFPSNEKEFFPWFWQGTNGYQLIDKLNAHAFNQNGYSCHFIRVEKYSPHIYGFVVEKQPVAQHNLKWYRPIAVAPYPIQLMKIGFTHKRTQHNSGIRIEQVMRDVKRRFRNFDTDKVFMLPIDFIDTTNPSEVEKNIRERMGVPVPKDIAQRCGLPVPSEWVLTSKKVCIGIKNKMDVFKEQYQENDEIQRVLTSSIFSEFTYRDFPVPYDMNYVVSGILRTIRELQEEEEEPTFQPSNLE